MLIDFRNITHSQRLAQCQEIDLPLSKSESNRALMILHYTKSRRQREDIMTSLARLSSADDTILLQNLLNKINTHNLSSVDSSPLTLDCGNAGTVLRFLITAVSTIHNERLTIKDNSLRFLLTGSERMKLRPVGDLVDALRSLGATIEYMEREGYPPVMVRGGRIDGGRVEVSAEHSSQFASSLLLAAPLWKNGLELHLTGNVSSLPYIDMTIEMMKKCGIDVVRNNRDIFVKHRNYNADNITIEPDWSSAAFWYEYIALSDNDVKILLKNLNINSLQADVAVIKMFEILGIETISSEDGIVIKKSTRHHDTETTFNFTDCPDLFPAVIAACAGLQIDATFTGIRNLSIKESDRKKAMMSELKKINISFENISDDIIKMRCPEILPSFIKENPVIFNTYGDHRVAMSLALLSLKIGTINIDDKDVVKKSYPKFWEDFALTI